VELLIIFGTDAQAHDFYKVISSQTTERYVTSSRWHCNSTKPSSRVLLSRVLDADLNKQTVLLRTAEGHYEEAIKNGVFSLSKAEVGNHEETICFGVNTMDCASPKESIPIFSDSHISMTCSECFVGAKATVFIEVEIYFFKLKKISTGLKNINVAGSFVLDMAANYGWSGTMDKTYYAVPNSAIIEFWVGAIPIAISYEIPLQIKASAIITANAAAAVGAKANWNIGDAFVSWSDNTSWVVSKPNPVFSWDHVLHGSAEFNAESEISLIPSINVNAEKLVQVGMKLIPTVYTKVNGNIENKELCADLSYRVICETQAELHVNIPLIFVQIDKIFGPLTLLDTEVQPIGHYCVKA